MDLWKYLLLQQFMDGFCSYRVGMQKAPTVTVDNIHSRIYTFTAIDYSQLTILVRKNCIEMW